VLEPKNGADLKLAARAVEPKSGRTMEIYTTQPAVQFYTGNLLNGALKSGGRSYEKHSGFCLETQHYPDSPNRPEFPTTLLKRGETYRETTVLKFGVN
jgi:aldose 1-epimerase